MIASSVTHRLALATAGCVLLMGTHRLHAQDVGLPELVRAALTRYADLDPLAVTWSESIEATPLGREKIAAKALANLPGLAGIQQLAFRGGRI